MDNLDNSDSQPKGRDLLLKLYSVNIRGLAQRNRGEQALIDIMLSKFNVIYIQETHVHNETQISRLSKIWRGPSYWDLGRFKSCGVAILIKENFPFKVTQIQKSNIGRYIIIDGILGDNKIRLINVYFPNTDKQRIDLINKLKTITPTTSALIIAGDFNFVEAPALDKSKGRMGSGNATRLCFNPFKTDNGLIDIFRFNNPGIKDYTHFDKPTRTKTRIDRIYADEITAQLASQISHVINTFADHSAVTATFKFSSSIGPGYWKCNISVLTDVDFKADFLALWNKLEKHGQNNLSTDWWDDCKVKVKDLILWHSSRLAKNRADSLNIIDK